MEWACGALVLVLALVAALPGATRADEPTPGEGANEPVAVPEGSTEPEDAPKVPKPAPKERFEPSIEIPSDDAVPFPIDI
jgi:hypothetical protein